MLRLIPTMLFMFAVVILAVALGIGHNLFLKSRHETVFCSN